MTLTKIINTDCKKKETNRASKVIIQWNHQKSSDSSEKVFFSLRRQIINRVKPAIKGLYFNINENTKIVMFVQRCKNLVFEESR